MKIIVRTVVLIAIVFLGEVGFMMWREVAYPAISTSLSSAAVNGSAVDAGIYRAASQTFSNIRLSLNLLYLFVFLFLFLSLFREKK